MTTQVLTDSMVPGDGPMGTGAEIPPGGGPIKARTPMQLALARLRKDKVAIAAGIIVLLLIIVAVVTFVWDPPFVQNPNLTDGDRGVSVDGLPVSPFHEVKDGELVSSSRYLMGTDELGRDIFARIVYGSQVSLFVGVVSTFIALVVGVTVGMFAGYFGGWVDATLQFIIDVVLSVPTLLFGIALAAIFSPSMQVTIGILAFFSWPAMARIVRGQVLSLREKEFVEAARSLGASDLRIIFTDILPNLIAPVIVYSTLILPVNIISEASLSFLGIGVPLPTATWGNMLSGSIAYYRAGVWWYFAFPGLALLITVLAFNLIGDGLRDALDPRAGRTMAKR